ncbi:MAG: hypothetical protein GF383_05715 [Candidatus Lokiarchaeota archaeon]|nr:hypothetical protein [Candidatus Lokiarchaeota archaeon]MBD3339428.1 hypothetical protein [Candidatus Lokiarchaeota archaeon]
MDVVVCKECGHSFNDGRDPGKYYCPGCEKEMKFYEFNAFCGSKPGGLHEK